jgi:hypothetical protein
MKIGKELELIEDTALEVGEITLVGSFGKYPREFGNCFGVITKNSRYRILNFVYENLENLIDVKKIEFPMNILVIKGTDYAFLHDKRIPENYYRNRICEVCCSLELLPYTQRLKHYREMDKGLREEKNGWIKITIGDREETE